jgi:hypothetical protein
MTLYKEFIKKHHLTGGEALLARQLFDQGLGSYEVEIKLQKFDLETVNTDLLIGAQNNIHQIKTLIEAAQQAGHKLTPEIEQSLPHLRNADSLIETKLKHKEK